MLGRDGPAKLIIDTAIAGRKGILAAPVNSPVRWSVRLSSGSVPSDQARMA
jgi:hypothetical protein